MRPVLALTICLFLAPRATNAQGTLSPQQTLGRDILRELIETNTTYSSGSTTKAAELMAARFRAAGFPAADIQIIGPDTGRDAKYYSLTTTGRAHLRAESKRWTKFSSAVTRAIASASA